MGRMRGNNESSKMLRSLFCEHSDDFPLLVPVPTSPNEECHDIPNVYSNI